MDEPLEVAPQTYVLPSAIQVPGVGFVPINAFLILGEEPILIDTGIATDREEFIAALRTLIDPSELKWLWLSHDDLDHIGSAQQIVEMAPNARILVHALIAIRLSSLWSVPLARVNALSVGTAIDIGDRELATIKPPLFDNPGSVGFQDSKTKAFFSVDAFGALLPRIESSAAGYTPDELARSMSMWATFDSSWVHLVDEAKYGRTLDLVAEARPSVLLSAHLPVARDMNERLLGILRSLPSAPPFIPPNSEQFSEVAKAIAAMRKWP